MSFPRRGLIPFGGFLLSFLDGIICGKMEKYDYMKPEWSKTDLKTTRNETKKGVDYEPKKRVNKTMKYVNSEGRLVNTKAYALAWGVINKPYSSKELYRLCQNPDAPSYTFIVKKCWNGYPRYYDALVRAGMEPRPPRTDMERRRILGKAEHDGFRNGLLDKDYDIAKIAAGYGVTTRDSYNTVRREKPESRVFLPSVQCIVRRFGSWKRFQYEIMKYNADAVLTEYVARSAERGHWLRIRECDSLKIPIRGIMDLLRPSLFNALCYRKLALMGKADSISKPKENE